MNEEVKTAEVTAKTIIEDNASLLLDLEDLFSTLKKRAKGLEDAGDSAKAAESLCKVADTIARIKRDAYMVEAGVLAQKINAKQMTESLLGKMSGGGGVPNIPTEIYSRINEAARGLVKSGLQKSPPPRKG